MPNSSVRELCVLLLWTPLQYTALSMGCTADGSAYVHPAFYPGWDSKMSTSFRVSENGNGEHKRNSLYTQVRMWLKPASLVCEMNQVIK